MWGIYVNGYNIDNLKSDTKMIEKITSYGYDIYRNNDTKNNIKNIGECKHNNSNNYELIKSINIDSVTKLKTKPGTLCEMIKMFNLYYIYDKDKAINILNELKDKINNMITYIDNNDLIEKLNRYANEL
jgi:hypothetical protein